MERVNIESEGSEEAEEESRRFKGDDASRSGNRSRKSSLSSIYLSKTVKQLNPEEVDILDWVANIEERVDDLELGDISRSGNRSGASSLSSFKGALSKAMKPLSPKGMDTLNLVANIHVEERVDELEQEYKSLTDVHRQDFQTYERVGRLLSQKKHGLGGWREVAHKYRMDHLDIAALKDDPEAGSKTLGFLESAVPGLTVYDFCETLKERHIRRLDIVKALENHFSAPGTASAFVYRM